MTGHEGSEGLTVAQMAEAAGVSAHTLRYYERAGLIRAVPRNGGNQRRYQPGDVEWVGFLLRLRETGMPVSRMREYASLRAQGDASLRARLELLVEHQERLRRQIAALQAHEQALAAKVRVYARLLDDHGGHEELGHE
ncbi:hypothetical protein GCM10009785_16120 [Brooklawnia cerclae]|uniref:DNA-binding transcriptional MerR regulator n=1 Tax=Brooklawnia cerclae TaxID=349934 RepID=A0ABX0SHI8_9ACTN|nr:MerR family transcriptional regulator [Brooklawnia cerclae]NIH57819.1 DNA-binding transcriptional MerR regulator [Brooklawnia cerclae]